MTDLISYDLATCVETMRVAWSGFCLLRAVAVAYLYHRFAIIQPDYLRRNYPGSVEWFAQSGFSAAYCIGLSCYEFGLISRINMIISMLNFVFTRTGYAPT